MQEESKIEDRRYGSPYRRILCRQDCGVYFYEEITFSLQDKFKKLIISDKNIEFAVIKIRNS